MTPAIALLLLQVMSWRMVFVVFGRWGWSGRLGWYRWFRDEPAEHPQVNAAELERILANRPPETATDATRAYWRRLLGQRNVLALCLMYLPNSYAFYFCITWLPTYLREKHGFTADVAGGVRRPAAAPSACWAICSAGVATDAVTARFGLRAGPGRGGRRGLPGGRRAR